MAAQRILVVASTSRMARNVTACLGDDREVLLASSYIGAKLQLTTHPDVLITEVKLGAYNGLHLALRGKIAGIPTIVVGPDDLGFAQEAERLGATYLVSDELDSEDFADVLGRMLERASIRVH